MSPFLNTGVIFANFQELGKIEVCKELLKNVAKCLTRDLFPSFSNRGDIESGPLALLVSNVLSISLTSSSVIVISFRLFVCCARGGRAAWLSSTELC